MGRGMEEFGEHGRNLLFTKVFVFVVVWSCEGA